MESTHHLSEPSQPSRSSYPRLKALRTSLFVIGAAMIGVAFLADQLGYGDTGSFGIGQFLLALIGLIVLLIGFFGKRFFAFYRDAATILLNTLVLLALVELTAIVIGRTSFQPKHTGIQDLPYYAAQDWTEAYWREANTSEDYRYEPYVGWRHLPFSGEMVNYDGQGIRQTPGAECGPAAYKVFTFGGSTMLGWGAPDWGTIPAYLQSGLETLVEGPVCVVNLAQDGYGSTQNLVALVLELHAGNVPDAVIFYDGVNEVIAAYESGQPSVHVTLSRIAARFEEQEPPLITWMRSTRTYSLMQRLLVEPRQEGYELHVEAPRGTEREHDVHRLADAMAGVYLGNYRIVEALAQEYGFDFYFFLQPHLAVSNKVLTSEEQVMRAHVDPTLAALANAYYESVALANADHEHLWNIAHVLDDQTAQIWFDEVGHITPEGNRLVATEMLAIIAQGR